MKANRLSIQRSSIFCLMLLFAISSYQLNAQTGPAGIGSNSTNVVWLRSDQGTSTTTNGAAVSFWNDISGNANNSAQVTGVNQPLYISSGMNGLPTLRFDGTNDYLSILDANNLDNTNGVSVFVVAQPVAPDALARGLVSKRAGAGSEEAFYLFSYTGSNLYFNAATDRINGNNAVLNQPQLYSAVYNGTIANPRSRIYYNGLESGNGNGPVSIGNMASDLHIGILNPGYAQGFNGDISEVIVYRNSLNAAERSIVETYLGNRYNITLGNSSYSSTTHRQNFIGIGHSEGEKYSDSQNLGSGILLSERNNTLDETNEFVFTGHDGTPHGTNINDLPAIAGVNLDDRWDRIYYIERIQGGTINAGSTDVRLSFDFAGTGITLATDRVYYLLYRAGTSGAFSEIPGGTGVASEDKVSINLSNANFISGYYTIAKSDQEIRTWYSLNSGTWDDFNTWSLKPTEPDNLSNEIPGILDRAVILNNKTVTVDENGTSCGVLDVIDGIVDFGVTTGNSFSTITGQVSGKIRLSADNFPSGDASGFADASSGGTVEYYGSGYDLTNIRTFRNLNIKLSNPANQIFLLANYTLNGNLTVERGELFFGKAPSTTTRTITVYENLDVLTNGKIRTSSVNARHQLNLYGNFSNQGDVQFTNRVAANYTAEATDGIVDVNFLSATRHQTLMLEGPTRFYRIAIEKGISSTYELYMEASDAAYFNLFGYANEGHPDVAQLGSNDNAFGLTYGTVRVGPNITIARTNGGGNYNVSEGAILWVDGGTVTKPAGTGEAVVVYGKVKVSNGTFNSYAPSGITTRLSGSFESIGGTTNLNQFRTSVYGSQHQGGYVQSGGTVNLVAGAMSADYYKFCLTYTGNVFNMSGGTLHIQQTGGRGAIFINSDEINQSITGGTVLCDLSNATDFIITSKSPFWNLELRKTVANGNNFILDEGVDVGGTDEYLAAQPLKVLRNFYIRGTESGFQGANFYPVTDATNVNDVYIGGSFFVESGSQYWTAADGNRANNYNNVAGFPTIFNTTYFNQTAGTSAINSFYWGNVGNVFDYDSNGTPDDDENMAEFGDFVVNRNHGNELRIVSPGPGVGLRDDASLTIDVNGDVTVESGTLDQGRLTFRIWGSITNNDRLGTYFSAGPYPTAAGTPSAAQIRFREDPPIVINASDDAVFGNIRFNVNPTTPITFTSNMYIERMQFMRGIVYIGKFNLKVDDMWDLNNNNNTDTDFFVQGASTSSYLRVSNSGRSTGAGSNQQIMIITDGKASDAGLSLKIRENSLADSGPNIRNNRSVLTYPIGFSTNNFATGLTNTYYRPAQVKTSNYSDDGYITIRPVRGVLQTTNLAGGEVLQHHWRVTHSNFTALPTVAYRYYYRNQSIAGVADLPAAAANEANYVPGKVLDDNPFTRSYESNTVPQQDVNGVFNSPADANTRVVVFNGNNAVATDDGLFGFSANAPGITVEAAKYTTGVNARFTGTVRIFYLRQDGNWRNGNTWSYSRGGGAAGTWPVAGDIAVIRRYSAAYNGIVEITNADACAKVVFDDENGFSSGCPRLWFSNAASFGSNFGVVEVASTHQGGVLNGEIHGAVIKYDLFEGYAGQFPTGDFGNFNNYPNALVIYAKEGATSTVTLSSAATEYPQIWFENSSTGGAKTFVLPDVHVTFNGMAIITGHTLRMNTGANCGATFKKRLNIGHSFGAGYFELAGNAVADQTVACETNINLYNSGSLRINSPAAGGRTHKIVLNNSITMETGCNINLGDGNPVNSNATLELAGEGTHTLTGAGTASVTLSRITMNKGASQSNTFSFNWPFTLTGPTNGTMSEKALQLQNGRLLLNSATTNINLSTGGGDFYIPSTSGLVVQAGEVNVSGANSGILLDGLLRVEGAGVIDMDGGLGVNNFIEYSASGSATIEVIGGSLTVGSQIRRGTSSSEGILNYTQTGGSVIVGKNAAPQANRGVFEVLNAGSRFIHTGGTLTVVRPQTGATEATVLLEPSIYFVGNTTLQLGNNDTPAASVLTLKSKIELGNLTVTGTNGPTARLMNRSLILKRDLTIGAGSSFDGTGLFNLTVNRHIVNSGTANFNVDTLFLRGNSTVPSAAMQNITGNIRAKYIVIEPETSVTLQAASNLEVDKDFYINSGQLVDGANTITVGGNVTNTASHASSNPLLGGIKFSGTTLQRVYGTGQFGRLEIDNTSSVQLENNMSLNNHLTLTRGILQLQSNKLTLGVNANIIKSGADFDDNKMIAVGGGDFLQGIEKTFPTVVSAVPINPYDETDASYSYEFTFPIGVDNGTVKKYTPVEFYIASNNTQGAVNVYPVNRKHITFDATQTDVLQYYWVINSGSLSNLTSLIHTHYKNSDVVGDEVAYIGARLYDDSWSKYEESKVPPLLEVVFEADDYVSYLFQGVDQISGEYTCGIQPHIPDVVPLFISTKTGNWEDADTWIRDGGGLVPAGGPVGQRVRITTGHTVTVTSNYRRAYKTTINGKLDLGTTINHILGQIQVVGYVEGTGTLALQTNSLPAGNLDNFCNCGGGTLEFGGITGGGIPSRTQFNNLSVVGSATWTMPSSNVDICGNLRIEGSSTLKMSGVAASYRYVTINGNVYIKNTSIWEQAIRAWVKIRGSIEKDNTATLSTNFSTSYVELDGTSTQNITGTYTGTSMFNNLRLNNPTTFPTTGPIDTRIFLYLINGRLQNSTANLLSAIRANGDGLNSVTNGFVEGPIRANLKSSSPVKYLPVGKNSIKKFINILDLPVAVGFWTGEYFNASPTSAIPSMSHLNMVAPLLTISQSEYWRISGPNAVNSRIQLTLNGTSDVAAGASSVNNLRIVYWNGTNWQIAGGGATVVGPISNGTITTTGNITFNGAEQFFTIGTIETVVVPTAQITSGNATICDGENYNLTITLTGGSPWEIEYSDGVTPSGSIVVNSSPHTIPLTPSGTTTYTLTAVRTQAGPIGVVYGSPATVTVRPMPTVYTVSGDGFICETETVSINLSDSEVGFTYELYRNGVLLGNQQAGTGNPISFTGIDVAGVYTIMAFNNLRPSCTILMDGDATVTVGSSAFAEITAVLSDNPICEGLPVQFGIEFSGTPPFTFSIADNYGNEWNDIVVTLAELTGVDPYTYTYTIPDKYPVWTAPLLPKAYIYNITDITDSSGCGVGSVGASETVGVYKIPETGPQYHIPNSFGE